MADRFYLSLWLEEHQETRMLERFRVLLEAFPHSEVRPGVQALRVHPLNWTEPLVVDHTFREGAEIGEALALAAEFTHARRLCLRSFHVLGHLGVPDQRGPGGLEEGAAPGHTVLLRSRF